MRVLHFYKTYFPDSFGGVEQTIFQLVAGSTHLGVKSTVLSLSSKKSNDAIGFGGQRIVTCKSNFKIASTNFSLSAFQKFAELSKTADIIHYHFPWPFMDMVHFSINHGKPSVVTYHSDIIKQKFLLNLYRPLKNKFLTDVDAIVSTSPNYFVTSNLLQQHRDKVEVIPIGIDRALYPPIELGRSEKWRSIIGEKFFLFIGVLRYYKGISILLDALALGDLPTVIVGAGAIEGELKKQAASLGLKNVKFLGFLSDQDKVAIIDLSFAIVFPSHLRSEAFGISLLEGAMFGKPMISSEIGTGTSFINIDADTGIVVPPSSPRDLHLAMIYLWRNPQIAKKMGINAAKRYFQLFTADKMCRSYHDLYKRII
ncbi:glycosyltransferase [Polynucleobacter sp. AP-Jannik-300A-C4]|uniref:glycosyltransferase n=1 Tax=Polynucleobacter sp. AP-Jannik-300A-C4 TaxID=2576928 RepID=UPI001BFE7AEE|nr:glycosyltransferase [Polynucleobacter sp. AP-Jannik-300A-C4]QWE22957.1 glycosyltransferase [Polynucleobacter sp. AP-Jannik-300A-C4]